MFGCLVVLLAFKMDVLVAAAVALPVFSSAVPTPTPAAVAAFSVAAFSAAALTSAG